jgi:hypothetical protein
MSTVVEKSFSFWMPISKAKAEKDGKIRIVEGIASTPHTDLQNEEVNQKGIDFSYFLKHGYFNWDHKPGADNKIGEPWEVKVTPNGLYVKGMLYQGKKVADAVWEHIKTLATNPQSKRRVGFSLQGKTLLRKGQKIARCWIQDIAITTAPINHHTYLDVVKSLSAYNLDKATGVGYKNPLVVESLAGDGDDKDKDNPTDLGWNGGKSASGDRRLNKSDFQRLISKNLGYSRKTSNLLSDILFELSV